MHPSILWFESKLITTLWEGGDKQQGKIQASIETSEDARSVAVKTMGCFADNNFFQISEKKKVESNSSLLYVLQTRSHSNQDYFDSDSVNHNIFKVHYFCKMNVCWHLHDLFFILSAKQYIICEWT